MNIKPIARLLVERPKTVLLVFTIVTILIGIQASHIYMDSDLSQYLPEDDPTVQLWMKIDQEFQIGSTILIYVEADDIRDPYVLREMGRVGSLVNKFENDKGEQDGVLSVRSLAALIKAENAKPWMIGGLGGMGKDEIPLDENLISRYLSRITIQQTKGVLFTNTYKVAVIIVQLAEDADYDEILAITQDAIDHRGTSYAVMSITGSIAMQQAIQKYSMQNLLIMFPIALVLVSIVLFFFHRTVKGIIIAFLPPAYALALTFGVLGAVKPELTIISVSIVALLMGLGVDYSIHLIHRYHEEVACGNEKALNKACMMIGRNTLVTSLTTMAAFFSMALAPIRMAAEYGIMSFIAISFSALSVFLFIPSLLMLEERIGWGS
ncbi:MAG: MMPL family transporter, partial [Methanophagales archaeon]|nr:MMPL family transporter [Methanophagales archaeon]